MYHRLEYYRNLLASLSIADQKINDKSCFTSTMISTTSGPTTVPSITKCDVENIVGWPGLGMRFGARSSQRENIELEFQSSHMDIYGNTVSYYTIRIQIGDQILSTWMLTLDLSIVFTSLEVLG